MSITYVKKTIACGKSYKEKKTDVLTNTELLLKGQKLIYSGFVNNIFDHDNVHQDGRKETFSGKI